jgi:hypothetical protein
MRRDDSIMRGRGRRLVFMAFRFEDDEIDTYSIWLRWICSSVCESLIRRSMAKLLLECRNVNLSGVGYPSDPFTLAF